MRKIAGIELVAVLKGAAAGGREGRGQLDGLEVLAVLERALGHRGDAGANGDLVQLVVESKRGRAPVAHSTGDANAGQGRAAKEGVVADRGHARRQVDLGQRAAAVKGTGTNDLQRRGPAHVGQGRAVVEGALTDRGHALGDDDLGDRVIALEGAVCDAGNGKKPQGGGNLDLAARAGVAGDHGLAQDVLVRKVAGLGLCDGRRLGTRGLGRDGRRRAQPRRHRHQRDRGGHGRTGKVLLVKTARRHGVSSHLSDSEAFIMAQTRPRGAPSQIRPTYPIVKPRCISSQNGSPSVFPVGGPAQRLGYLAKRILLWDKSGGSYRTGHMAVPKPQKSLPPTWKVGGRRLKATGRSRPRTFARSW